MLKRIAIFLIIALPLNIFKGYIWVTFSIIFAQAIFYFLFEFGYLLKDKSMPIYSPAVYAIITSVNGVGRGTAWIVNKWLPQTYSEIDMVNWIISYIIISSFLFSFTLKAIEIIKKKNRSKDCNTLNSNYVDK